MNALGIKGLVITRLWTPRSNLLGTSKNGGRLADHLLKDMQEMPNLVTTAGDKAYGDAFAGLHVNATVTDPNPVKGMNLSTQTTVAAKAGVGSYIVTGITGSGLAIDAGFPTSTIPASARRITWETTWGAGVATNAAIGSASICNPAGAIADSNAEADTVAYVVFGATIDKQAGDTLVVTWHHDLLGA